MHLREYLADPSTLTVSALRHKMAALGSNIKADAQIRQWVAVDDRGQFKRQPSPANAHFLELATDGKVTRKDMRPKDYAAIWPELANDVEPDNGPPVKAEPKRRKGAK